MTHLNLIFNQKYFKWIDMILFSIGWSYEVIFMDEYLYSTTANFKIKHKNSKYVPIFSSLKV